MQLRVFFKMEVFLTQITYMVVVGIEMSGKEKFMWLKRLSFLGGPRFVIN